MTLYAFTDLSNRNQVNVNLLTHLEHERSIYLLKNNDITVKKAKEQAENEILASFGIEGDFGNSEDMNVFGTSDGSAALLAISILMQSDLKEGAFSKRLADYASDIEADGVWDNEKVQTAIADWAANTSLKDRFASIRKNIEGWELSDKVPAFEKYVNSFWWENYKLGTCTTKREGEVKKNGNSASALKDMEFICLNGAWLEATDFTRDTFDWKDATEGDIKKGNATDTVYVFKDKKWNVADEVEAVLGGCVKATADSVGKASNTWYICKGGEWAEAKQIEYDTYRWEAGEDGDTRQGDVYSSVCYVYDGDAWRQGDYNDCNLGMGGCTKARENEEGKASNGEKYVCTDISGAGNYSWKIRYTPAGTCSPSKTSATQGEKVTWTFTMTTPTGSSVTELMQYKNMVNSSTCEWTMTGATLTTRSGTCGNDGKTATATYSIPGTFSTSLTIGENTIDCGSVVVEEDEEP